MCNVPVSYTHLDVYKRQVLEYGMLQDWNIVKQYYGLGRIVEIAKGFRELEPRALAPVGI